MRVAGLLILASLLLPVSVQAAELININTADVALLDTLPGIGPSKAAAIVDYRTQHGPFARIEDIQNVSGIGPTTYADIASLITVGDSGTAGSSTSSATSTTASDAASSGGGGTYKPPSAIALEAGSNQTAVTNVPIRFFAQATIKGAGVDPSAKISWGFGDGSSAEGFVVEKAYHHEGTYLVVVTAIDGIAAGRDEFTVTVRPARVRIPSVSQSGIMIANDANERLDLSGWALFAGTGSYRIPEGTVILPRMTILLPATVTRLTSLYDATLAYPDGVIAAHYPPIVAAVQTPAPVSAVVAQPSVSAAGYEKVQKVEPISSTKENIQAHDEAVGAPAAAMKLAAAGAAVPDLPDAVPVETGARGILDSPWVLGLLGVIALAGGAFTFL